MSYLYVAGGPGVRSARTADFRRVFLQSNQEYLSVGRWIDGTKAGDPGNTSDTDKLRAGLIMGKITSGGKYATCILGVLQNAESATGTSIDVTVAQAVEIDRRIGQSGTLTLVGPPSAAGTVATFTETFSAVNTSTGEITVSALNADLIAGSFVMHNDGSETPVTFLPDGYPIKVSDPDGTRRSDIEFPKMPISGVIDSSQLIDWPSDTSLQAWLVGQLNAAAGGQYVFDHRY